MSPRTTLPEPPPQPPQQLATLLQSFLTGNPHATAAEDGKILFDLRSARYSISTEHDRCTLQLWSDDRNIVRQVVAAELHGPATLRLRTRRLGHPRPQTLELSSPQLARRTPGARETTRTRYLPLLERALLRHLPGWRAESFRTAMDLEKSFGPAYARGLLLQGQHAWAVIAVNDQESTETIDGILTFGILWLAACRESAASSSRQTRLVQGLRLVLPRGTAAATLSRIAWLAGPPAQWQLFELDQPTEELTPRDSADHGNLATRLLQAPPIAATRARFSASIDRVMQLIPPEFHPGIVQHVRSGTELAFLLHGFEFARIRLQASSENFNRIEQITFGDAASETALTPQTEPHLRELVHALCLRRQPGALGRKQPDKRDPLYRLQPERWLESRIARDLTLLDPRFDPTHVYSQVPAIAGVHGLTHAPDRGLLDLLSVTDDGRLAVIEIKASEDPHLALQGLDYWIRVRWHHQQHPDPATGLAEFQRHGYFPGIHLSPEDPRLYLVAPALHIHPATEVILRHLSPGVDWTLIALDERWRSQIKVTFRKRAPLHPQKPGPHPRL